MLIKTTNNSSSAPSAQLRQPGIRPPSSVGVKGVYSTSIGYPNSSIPSKFPSNRSATVNTKSGNSRLVAPTVSPLSTDCRSNTVPGRSLHPPNPSPSYPKVSDSRIGIRSPSIKPPGIAPPVRAAAANTNPSEPKQSQLRGDNNNDCSSDEMLGKLKLFRSDKSAEKTSTKQNASDPATNSLNRRNCGDSEVLKPCDPSNQRRPSVVLPPEPTHRNHNKSSNNACSYPCDSQNVSHMDFSTNAPVLMSPHVENNNSVHYGNHNPSFTPNFASPSYAYHCNVPYETNSPGNVSLNNKSHRHSSQQNTDNCMPTSLKHPSKSHYGAVPSKQLYHRSSSNQIRNPNSSSKISERSHGSSSHVDNAQSGQYGAGENVDDSNSNGRSQASNKTINHYKQSEPDIHCSSNETVVNRYSANNGSKRHNRNMESSRDSGISSSSCSKDSSTSPAGESSKGSIPCPPPRTSSRTQSTLTAPEQSQNKQNIGTPQYSNATKPEASMSKLPPPSTKANSQGTQSNRHDRQKAKALFAAVKRREDTLGRTSSVENDKVNDGHANDKSKSNRRLEITRCGSEPPIKTSQQSSQFDSKPAIKPSSIPLNNPNSKSKETEENITLTNECESPLEKKMSAYSHLKNLSPTTRANQELKTFLAEQSPCQYSDLNKTKSEAVDASRKQFRPRSSSSTFDSVNKDIPTNRNIVEQKSERRLSDCGNSTEENLSDNQSGIGMYARKMQQRFKEGMQAVQESLRNSNLDDVGAAEVDASDDNLSLASSSDLRNSPPRNNSRKENTEPPPRPPRSNMVSSSSFSFNNTQREQIEHLKSDAFKGYLSDFDDPKCDDYTALRKYASDIEGDCDFDITSSCSMDLLTGNVKSEYYFSDTESLSKMKEALPPGMTPRSLNLNSNLTNGKVDPASKQNPGNYLKFLQSKGLDSMPNRKPISPMHLMNYPKIPGRNIPEWANRVASMPKQAFNKSGPTESNSLGTIRIEAGPATADEDFETSSFPSSLNFISKRAQESANGPLNVPTSCFTSMKVDIPSPQRESVGWSGASTHSIGPTSPGISSFSNVKLPYATPSTITASSGVPSSFSNCSLSKMEFNEEIDGTRGSRLSLASTGSCRSLNEERQAQEIRKLRRELEMAQQKIKTLYSQVNTNAHVVSAFEQSLNAMTSRLKSLSSTADEKESELTELRNTIESLRRQSTAMFSGMSQLNETEIVVKSNIQPSESLVSLVSDTSSVGEGDKKSATKQKKSGWLRHSFGKAFRKKSSKFDFESDRFSDIGSGAMGISDNCPQHSDFEKTNESTDSTPNDTNMEQLKRELDEKSLRLTDVQLDALSSAHQLDQLRDLMTEMRNEMSTLKADNERLQRIVLMCANNEECLQTLIGENRQTKDLQPIDAEKVNSKLSEKRIYDFLAVSTLEEGGKRLIVSVHLDNFTNASSRQSLNKSRASDLSEIDIGCVSVNPSTTWQSLSTTLRKLFREYVSRIDPAVNLGLTCDSLQGYYVGNLLKSFNEEVTECNPTPLASLHTCTEEDKVRITLHGNSTGSVSAMDALAFATLIPKTVLQRYVSLLCEHRRIMLCGPSGTGKSFLANRLAEYLVIKNNKALSTRAIANFKVDHKSHKELRSYLTGLAEQIENQHSPDHIPTVIILDNLHHVTSLCDVFNSFLSVKDADSPYIIGTMNQATYSTANLQLHHNFRWVLCANHIEPVKGLLRRFLQRKLVQVEVETQFVNQELHKVVEWIPSVWQHINRFLEAHSSSDVTIGPRSFLSCPMTLEGSKIWFTDLWNYSLVPYVLEAVREGLAQYGKRTQWEDPFDWISISWPWSSSNADGSNLMRLRPEDVGYENQSSGNPLNSKKSVDTMLATNSSTESVGDPLMNMLLRLQEVSSYSGNQTDSDSSSLERTANKRESIS